MSDLKTKSIKNIEMKMEDMDYDSMRFKALESVKNFKTSWIQLGQILYTVWKDKLYKEWGFQEFDNYTTKEIGIKKPTAMKLLRSYSFLEKEEPKYLQKEYTEDAKAGSIPSFEAVDVLRQANNKDIDREDYSKIKKYVLEDGKDAKDVKKELTEIIKQQEELDPADVRAKRRGAMLKRFVGMLKSVRSEIKMSKMLPQEIMKEVDSLISKIEGELPREGERRAGL